jgi:DNA-binding NarL/FixJ family response regulator
METKRKILVIGDMSFFTDAVAALLGDETDFQVSRVCPDVEGRFYYELADAQADVVILSRTDTTNLAWIFGYLAMTSTLKKAPVIVVRRDDNALDVYEQHRIDVTRSDDLLAVIRNTEVDAVTS